MKMIFSLTGILFSTLILHSQNHHDYLGPGHDSGITVTTSHSQQTNSQGDKTVDGFPVDDSESLVAASRFLSQATLGYDYKTIQQVAAMGYEAW